MARVTIDDCLDVVGNRFDLVIEASKRARQISLGSEPKVEARKDKPTVVALREIEAGLTTPETIQEEQNRLEAIAKEQKLQEIRGEETPAQA